jgi:hypothetical protein
MNVTISECFIHDPAIKWFEGKLPESPNIQASQGFYYSTTRDWFSGQYPRKGYWVMEGESEGRDAFRNAEMLPNILPVENLGAKQDPAEWIEKSANLAITGGQVAPDGSNTAYRLSVTSGILAEGKALRSNIAWAEGDFVIAGMWVKSAVAGQRMNAGECGVLTFNGASPGLDGTNLRFLWNDRLDMPDHGWTPVVRWYQVTGGPGTVDTIFAIRVYPGFAFDVWKPFLLHVNGAAWTARDVARLAARLTVIDELQRPGVLTMLPHQTFRTGQGASSARPDATSVGQGAQWFDATLNKPIWSDGTNWRDALGVLA